MQVLYKNNLLERWLIGINVMAGALVAASFMSLFGFDRPLLPPPVLYGTQWCLLVYFISEKIVRTFNAEYKWEYVRANWFEIPLFLLLVAVVFTKEKAFQGTDLDTVVHIAVGTYLVLQVVGKVCRTTVHLASLGTNPTRMLIASFLTLILVGAGVLCLPKATQGEPLSFVDALFTATSATCVTGLVVRDTGQGFTLMGQSVILGLIQLGGLGIVVFGAVFSLILGQAFSIRESAAMQDLVSAQTLSRIGTMIAFIFMATLIIEIVGMLGLYWLWDNNPDWAGTPRHRWFFSLFHSISAFCNAGFGLFDNSLTDYNRSWGVYSIICPLIILGGLGFGVLYNLCNVFADQTKRFTKTLCHTPDCLAVELPKRITLQTKIVLSLSFLLITIGAVMIFLMEHSRGTVGPSACPGVLDALFQSVTARTAGFNTVNINDMTAPSKLTLILLMFVGGSPGSTAGGIKTVTLAVIAMTVITTLRKRSEVEIFRRSIRPVVVGRAITVTVLFAFALFIIIFLLCMSEGSNPDISLPDLVFEATSALGTVGLTTGITGILTSAGKLIIIVAMLIGRLGPLTLLAALTFDLKPVKYNYPQEAIIVG